MVKYFVVVLALCCGSAHAVRVFGNMDCGRWVKNNSAADRSWLAGFLSGMVLAKPTEDLLESIESADQFTLWMDNYCKANPLSYVSVGSILLLDELRQKAKRR